MEVLLAKGANIILRDSVGASTLHYAVNTLACTKLAIQRGCKLNEVDYRERTALNYWAMMEDPLQGVFRLLQEVGVDANAFDFLGMTAVDCLDLALGFHEFEEKTRWIDLQRCAGRFELQYEVIFLQLRESSAQSWRDNLNWYKEIKQSREKSKQWWIVSDEKISTKSAG